MTASPDPASPPAPAGAGDGPPPRSLSIVIPAYNEKHRLPGTLEEISRFLQARRYRAEILVVDDGSRDGTLETLNALRSRHPLLEVLSYPDNRGKGFAVRTGVLASRLPTVLFSDADLSTPIAEVEKLWPHYDRGCDVVIASRSMARSEILGPQPLHRRTLGRIFNLIVSFMGLRGFHDTQCGFKMFRAEAARAIFGDLRTTGFAFDVEVLWRARKMGCRTAEVPVRWINAADSKVRPVLDSARMLMELLRLREIA